jgi:hypothetical protein
MKAIIALMSLAFLTACATPYYPVYSGNPGDYYIADSETTAYYDPYAAVYEGSEPGSLRHLGMSPWWGYSYYSPYFYPHHFSVWYPRSYYDYGWSSGYYPYWCPPYRYVAARRPVSSPLPGDAPFPSDPGSAAPRPGYPILSQDVTGEAVTITDRFESRSGNAPAVLVRAPTVGSNSTRIRSASRYSRYRSVYPSRSSSFSTRSMGTAGSYGGSGFSSMPSRRISSGAPRAPSIHDQ